MELWMWIIVVALAVGGFLYGLMLGRSRTDDADVAREKSRSLECELSTTKDEFSRYREDVNGHFKTTAELIQQMTDSYKAVYRHLASGSQELCSGQVMLDLDDAPRLSGANGSGNNAGNNSSGEGSSVSAEKPTATNTKKKTGDGASDDARSVH